MLKKVLKLNEKNNILEAIFFYFTFFIIGGLLGAILGGIFSFGLTDVTLIIKRTSIVAHYAGILYISIVGIILLKNKRLFYNFGAIVLFLIAVLFSNFAACLLGLLPLAIITMFETNYE